MIDRDRHQASILDQFTRQAAGFAALPAHSDRDALRLCCELARLGPDDTVLDVACGPGILACALAATARHVTGLDLTPAMIAQARQRQQEAGLANLSWEIGDGHALPFADGAFSLVTSRYAFHHLLDPRAMLAEMRRVCAVGGRLLLIDATPTAATQEAYDAMETLRDPSHTSALTLDQMRGLGQQLGLSEQAIGGYRLEVELEAQLRAAACPAGAEERLRALFRRDAEDGLDRLGVGARYEGDEIRFCYPISILVLGRES